MLRTTFRIFRKDVSSRKRILRRDDPELLELMYFSGRFRCYLEKSETKVVADCQVIRNLFSRQNTSRRNARWLGFLGQFGISKPTLVKEKIYVLGDFPSRSPHSKHTSSYSNTLKAVIAHILLLEDFSSIYPRTLLWKREKGILTERTKVTIPSPVAFLDSSDSSDSAVTL